MAVAGANLLFIQLTAGSGSTQLTLNAGFITASILPISNATYTITNSLGDLPGVTSGTSASISSVYTFPSISGVEYDSHVITVTSGTIEIWYITGQ